MIHENYLKLNHKQSKTSVQITKGYLEIILSFKEQSFPSQFVLIWLNLFHSAKSNSSTSPMDISSHESPDSFEHQETPDVDTTLPHAAQHCPREPWCGDMIRMTVAAAVITTDDPWNLLSILLLGGRQREFSLDE